jgi:L-arabinokinase
VRKANIAVLVSGHGYGHLTRTATILSALSKVRPVSLRVITSAPAWLWPQDLGGHTVEWIQEPCDAGVVQTDDLSVDELATRRAVEAWEGVRSARLGRLTDTLLQSRERIDLVIGDVPALAFDVAAAVAAPSLAIANFSWDWIYDEMRLAVAADSARCAYEKADLLLELTPAAPMPAFVRRRRLGTLGRDSSARRVPVRAALGFEPTELIVLLGFREPTLSRITLPQQRAGVRFLSMQQFARERRDVSVVPSGSDFTDALAASDVVVAKTGYGILADCVATGRRLLWVSREGFPEDRVLESWLETQGWAIRLARSALVSGSWATELRFAAATPPPPPLGDHPVRMAVDAIQELLS